MKKINRWITSLLVIIFVANFVIVVPASAVTVSKSEQTREETAIIDGVTYIFNLYYRDDIRTVSITNNKTDNIDVIRYDIGKAELVINGERFSTCSIESGEETSLVMPKDAEPGWEVKTSGTHYVSWAQGTTVAVVAAALSVYLGTLGPAGVIAAMGTGALGALAASCSGGTIYMEYQVLIMVGVNQQRWMWTFTASTDDFYGPFYSYVVM